MDSIKYFEKAKAFLILVLSLLLASCSTLHYEDSGTGEKWDLNSPLFTIDYDGTSFSSNYTNVLFLEKTKDTFTILNLSDIQINHLNLSDKSSDIKTFKADLEKLINRSHPDLITFTGDFGDYSDSDKSLLKVSSIINTHKIPWAPVFGNHDNAGSGVIRKAQDLESFDYSLFKAGPDNLASLDIRLKHTDIPALGNYVINIVERDQSPEGFKLVCTLIFMNTGNLCIKENTPKDKNSLISYGSLSAKQIQWYKWAVKSAQAYNGDVPSILFIHIPVFAYNDAFKAWKNGDVGSFGVFHDIGICSSNYNDHVFEAIKEMQSTKIVLCGHDHTNNAVINYQDVILAYSMKTGTGSYCDPSMTGGTRISVTGNSIDIDHIVLSESFKNNPNTNTQN